MFMKKFTTALLFIVYSGFLVAQTIRNKQFTVTPTYPELVKMYQHLDQESNIGRLIQIGTVDGGSFMYAYFLSHGKCESLNDAVQIAKIKPVLFINNGIHPGEPDGIDASIELVRTLQKNSQSLPKNLLLVIIPAFNIDGMLNRNSNSRINQNGPMEHGFRANSQNLDLNRDFIKTDAKATQVLITLFQLLQPDIFVDTHVSNGADYQHTMTLICSQKNKLHPLLSSVMTDTLQSALYAGMAKKNWLLVPYVQTKGETPETGIIGFLETPRYSTGYAALFNCIGFVTETHMWKPYNDRVWATYDILLLFIELMEKYGDKIRTLHLKANAEVTQQSYFPLNWELDTAQVQSISFSGYEAHHKISTISSHERLYYDRNAPFTKSIPYYNTYKATQYVEKPWCYIIPQAWSAVIDRLRLNGVQLEQLSRDTTLVVEASSIESYQTTKNPYEGHYLHSAIRIRRKEMPIRFYAGDYIVPMQQISNRYIIETLEAESSDSFFAWNFFDGILMQKEGFSDYMFEEKAEEILQQNPEIQKELQQNRLKDTAFANSHWLQLNFIYQRSIYKEQSHNRCPVYRLLSPVSLPLTSSGKR
jgi:hypothetical protein